VLITLAVATLPFFHFAYHAPDLRAVVETVNAVVALLVAYLVYGRFREGRGLQELLLALALATVAVANLVLTALPDALSPARGGSLSQWAPLAVRLLGTALLAAAALTPTHRRVGPRRTLLVVSVLLAVLGALGAAGLTGGRLLPPAVNPQLIGDAARPLLVAHPVVLVAQGVGVALYAVAAVVFTRQADRTGDQLIRWVAAGCVLASFARVHYLLYPSLYTEFLYTGDLLRLGFYLFMLIGAAREITTYWEAKAHGAVLEDRRRLARDLHDGLIQELSYITAQSRRLTADPGDLVAVDRIAGAAGRAADESRRAIAALTRPTDQPFAVVLREAVDEMAGRYDVRIVASIDPHTVTDPLLSEALLRITAEAVRNAVRHGGARRIDVMLDAAPLALTVRDDGRGFDPAEPRAGRSGGFGLTSMRERAAAVGGTLVVESRPDHGTTVKVRWT
jgi:signal transduction histidine kinase